MTGPVPRHETFAVEAGYLIRKVVPHRGQPYAHRCPRQAFEQITHAAEELGEKGFTLRRLLDYERGSGRAVTFTDIAVVLAFLRERGILDVRYRRNYAASSGVHLDAMVEYFVQANGG
jgi:hypothetical protein